MAARIVEDFYVDNALFGFDDISHATEAQTQLIKMLKTGGFELHKWASNCPELLQIIPEADREELTCVGGSVNEVIKALGLLWDPTMDQLLFVSPSAVPCKLPTKRQVLLLVASMFDPTGTAAPVVLIGKLLMQRIWERRVGWDEPIPTDLVKDFEDFLEAVCDVNMIRIPRMVVITNASAYELHGYADASQFAYGACVYVKSIVSGEPPVVRLLCAKSKLVPKSVLTIPRKELWLLVCCTV
ncbi:uncharacterized protein LOC131693911 [Topomyia yanbarensis]|uniref:uncharacterized protein LOC131693911 n=1 Tax=Topomyia yanbarensis TaxID=2498891 RepID=UPI00273C6A3A|nr:uncharacterized protein LOC131693911 [Topomyia yanbarensis]